MSEDDPHGYRALIASVSALASRLMEAGDREGALMLDVASRQTMPSELLGECGLALRQLLDSDRVPVAERDDAIRVLEDIRAGFRRVGTEPSF